MVRTSKGLVWRMWYAVVMSIWLVAGCTGETLAPSLSPRAPGSSLAEIDSWVYQLQNISIDDLSALDVDLIVMDYAKNDGTPFTQAEIDRIKSGGKIVLSYWSIGEAESYRPYWREEWGASADDCLAPLSAQAPDWIEPMNPEWCGNYPVQFWQVAWQTIVMEYLDAILLAGFDGVYLDKVDVFYYWLDEEDMGQTFSNPDAPRQMVELVGLIAEHGRERHPGFILVPQNAAEIVAYLSVEQQDEYLKLIDGIGVEDTFFYPRNGAEAGEDAPYNPQEYILDLLSQYQAAGLPVLAIDYVTEIKKIERFFDAANTRGFIPYTSNRELDRIGTTEKP
ncbi:MAG: endo alpha-1,4 polygalactosaminidase [Anaerolineae bacterium]|nr:endo alpha-1,4 polygalactosaminidase [Anaerolineae bacterium]